MRRRGMSWQRRADIDFWRALGRAYETRDKHLTGVCLSVKHDLREYTRLKQLGTFDPAHTAQSDGSVFWWPLWGGGLRRVKGWWKPRAMACYLIAEMLASGDLEA